jgi:hypothetical protein
MEAIARLTTLSDAMEQRWDVGRTLLRDAWSGSEPGAARLLLLCLLTGK